MNNTLKAEIVRKFGTQADFAQALGINDARVSRIVRNRERLSPKEKNRWATCLGVSQGVFDDC